MAQRLLYALLCGRFGQKLPRFEIMQNPLENPWIFKRILHYLKTGELLPEPTAQERVEKALRHSQMLIAYKGEYIGIREMRKHMAWYMKGLPGAAELRGKLNYAETMAEMKALLHEYLKDHQ